jgi:hypothetical protein
MIVEAKLCLIMRAWAQFQVRHLGWVLSGARQSSVTRKPCWELVLVLKHVFFWGMVLRVVYCLFF